MRDIESSKIEYLKSKIELQESRKLILNSYLLAKKRVEIIQKKIELSKEDELSYLKYMRVQESWSWQEMGRATRLKLLRIVQI